MYLFSAAFKQYKLLALIQTFLPHGPELQDNVLLLQQVIQSG